MKDREHAADPSRTRSRLRRAGIGALTTARDDGRDFGEAGNRGDDSDAGDRTTHVGAVDHHPERRARFSKAVAFPERGPRRDDQDDPGLEKVRGEQQPAEDPDDQLPVCTFERRLTRAATSR